MFAKFLIDVILPKKKKKKKNIKTAKSVIPNEYRVLRIRLNILLLQLFVFPYTVISQQKRKNDSSL